MSEAVVKELWQRLRKDNEFYLNLRQSPLETLSNFELTDGEKAQFILPNFSWLIEKKLAGVAYPSNRLALKMLKKHGIRGLVNLTDEPISENMLKEFDFETLVVPIRDFSPPTMEQIEQTMSYINRLLGEGTKVAVHCQAGMGRTGTMLACYLVQQGSTAEEAIQEVRTKRPGSIETEKQTMSVKQYAAYRENKLK